MAGASVVRRWWFDASTAHIKVQIEVEEVKILLFESFDHFLILVFFFFPPTISCPFLIYGF